MQNKLKKNKEKRIKKNKEKIIKKNKINVLKPKAFLKFQRKARISGICHFIELNNA